MAEPPHPSTPPGATPPGGALCVACRSEIADGAGLCVHCGSRQGWISRYVGASATVLSLLIALGSVIGLVAPTIVGLLAQPASNVVPALAHVSQIRLDPGDASGRYRSPSYGVDVVLGVTNGGDLGGALGTLTVSLYRGETKVAEGTAPAAVPVASSSTEVHVVSVPLTVRDSVALPVRLEGDGSGQYVTVEPDGAPGREVTSVGVDRAEAVVTVFQAGDSEPREREISVALEGLEIVAE